MGLPPSHVLPVLGYVRISAAFDCEGRAPLIVRFSRSLRGAPWLDTVLYSAGSGAVCVGQVCTLLRQAGGDVAIIREMAPVDPVAGCSFVARGCTRLKWAQRPGEEDCAVRVVPVAHIVRVVHVVPDLQELGDSKGVAAKPAGDGHALSDRLSRRYFLSVSDPWGVLK